MSWIQIWKKSKRNFGWRHVNKACEFLYHKYDNPTPTKIVALARGGLVPATIMANKLGVRHVYSLGLSSYEQYEDGVEKPNKIEMYQRIPANVKRLKYDEHLLIVDDISDRGGTFIYAKKYLSEILGGNVHTMSLVIKPGTKHVPDYYYESAPDDQWIVFPWEK